MSEGMPDITTWEAAEGTAFHYMMGHHLEHGVPFGWFLGQTYECEGHVITFNEEMVHSAQEGVAFVDELLAKPGWEVRIETQVDISPWAGPGQFGNADVIAWSEEERRIVVFDWKYGSGVAVHAKDSYQIRGYALGAWHTFCRDVFGYDDPPTFDLMIEQPRIAKAGGRVEMSLAKLFEFGALVAEASSAIRDHTEQRTPGDKQCAFCPGRKKCPDFAAWNLQAMSLEFEDLDNPAVELPRGEMTPQRRSAILLMRPMIIKWLDDLHAEAYRDAELGRPTPGLKLTLGRRPRRAWKADTKKEAEEDARMFAGEAAFTKPALISPAQLEKKTGKPVFSTYFKGYVWQGEAKRVLVADDGDEETRLAPVADGFDNLDEEESVL